jgi:hypothetical protein
MGNLFVVTEVNVRTRQLDELVAVKLEILEVVGGNVSRDLFDQSSHEDLVSLFTEK